jgi:hypothetical protein
VGCATMEFEVEDTIARCYEYIFVHVSWLKYLFICFVDDLEAWKRYMLWSSRNAINCVSNWLFRENGSATRQTLTVKCLRAMIWFG